MQVTLKLFAGLGSYLGAAAVNNAVHLQVADDTTPNQLLEQFSLPRNQVHLVLVNGVYVAEAERARPLKPGDVLAIWPPVAGG